MKFVILMVAMLLASCASTTPTSKKPVRVVGQGPTFEIAKQNGFREAIEISVGTLIIADRNIQNSRIIKDEMGRHSSGYIEDYKIVNKIESDQVTLIMDVTVSESKIYERMLGSHGKTNNIEGQKLYTQIQTYQQSKETGQRIVYTILQDYPKNAFVINNPEISCGNQKGKYCLRLNTDGTVLIEVPFEAHWNYNFVNAMRESLAYISDSTGSEKFTIISKKPGSIVGDTSHYWFIDRNILYGIKRKFVGNVYAKSNVMDQFNNILYTGCQQFFGIPHVDYTGFLLDANDRFTNKVYIKIANPNKLKDANRIDVTVTNRPC